MSNNTNIQSMKETAGRIFEATHSVLVKMSDGDRIQIKQLAQDVSLLVGLDSKRVLGYVNDFAHQTDIAYVTRGKKGGIIKGTRPAKVVKAKKAKKADTAPVTDSTQ